MELILHRIDNRHTAWEKEGSGMKVWCVLSLSPGFTYIEMVFSSAERAEGYVKAMNESDSIYKRVVIPMEVLE